MTGLLKGKIALITGAARGQGGAEAKKFLEEGARVVMGDVLDEQGEALAKELGEDASYMHLDVTDSADWEKAIARAGELGGLNVLVNNAAIYWVKSIRDEDIEEVRRMLDVNLLGAFRGIQLAAEPMIDGGGGSIVNISSVGGLAGVAAHSAYAMSKWAMRGLSRTAAVELGQYNIRVNSIHPGPINTDMLLAPLREDPTAFESLPLKRMGEPEEVANLAAYLASDSSSFQTGGEYVIDGGSMAGISITRAN